MKLVYTGAHPDVFVPDIPGGEQRKTVVKSEQVDVPDELAKRLLEQTANWAKPKGATTSKGA